MGVAAEIETRKIQGRGAFLHSRVIRSEKTRKETKNAYERPKNDGCSNDCHPQKKRNDGCSSPNLPKIGSGEVY